MVVFDAAEAFFFVVGDKTDAAGSTRLDQSESRVVSSGGDAEDVERLAGEETTS